METTRRVFAKVPLEAMLFILSCGARTLENTCGAGPRPAAGSQPAYRATGAGRPKRPAQAEGLAEGLPHGMCAVPLFFRPILARRAGMGTLVRAASGTHADAWSLFR